MNDAARRGSRFDPRNCPLLQGLSAEEQRQRMRDDPRIRACVTAVEGGGECAATRSKQLAAYELCRHRLAAST